MSFSQHSEKPLASDPASNTVRDSESSHTSRETDEKHIVKVPTTHDVRVVGDSESNTSQETPGAADLSEDGYPKGLKLVILTSASLVAMFLISLDQVSGWMDKQQKPKK